MKENSFNLDPEKVNHVFHAKNIFIIISEITIDYKIIRINSRSYV